MERKKNNNYFHYELKNHIFATASNILTVFPASKRFSHQASEFMKFMTVKMSSYKTVTDFNVNIMILVFLCVFISTIMIDGIF